MSTLDPTPTVYVVDDDPLSSELVCGLANRAGHISQRYGSAESFLEIVEPGMRGVLVVDIRMDGMSGLQLQAELLTRSVFMPVIVVSGHAEIGSAVLAMKQKAFDFFEKPIESKSLLDSIDRALEFDISQAAHRRLDLESQARYATLTPREQEVMGLVVQGLANKRAAVKLGLSEKTIEVHRGNVMKKMRVDSLAELVRAAIRCGVTVAR